MHHPLFSSQELQEIRENFPHTETGHIYLNHAAISPISADVRRSIDRFLDDRQTGAIDNIELGMAILADTREMISEYIGAPSAESVTFTTNTSEGITAVAEGLDWNSGDEVILNTMEFPANVQPYRAAERHGIKIRYIDATSGTLTPDMVRSEITQKTRLISLSAVQYLTGYRAGLEEIGAICRENNILFVVDGIQSLGAFRIDVEKCGIDALATGGHKWLMSPMGTGFLYLSDKLAAQMTPSKTGWLSVQEPWQLANFDQEWLPVSQHLEIGTPNILGIAGMQGSLKTLQQIGFERISSHIQSLSGIAQEKLQSFRNITLITPTAPENRSGIITFRIDGTESVDGLVESLKKQNITISSREGCIRLSPHYYNSPDEIESAIDEILKSL
jgi:cysteine desulfurase / selenocysteine lyase